jgi:hypothetical protein
LADQAGRIGPLTALDESGGNGRTGGSGEFFELCAAGVKVEGGDCVVREVFLSRHDGGCCAGKPSGCGKLLTFAKLSSELDYDKHGKFLLRLRGAEFTGEERCVLCRAGFDKTTSDCLSAIPA